MPLYKLILKIILTSILTGALFFCNCAVFGQSEKVVSDINTQQDSSLLVNTDTNLVIKATSKGTFTDINSKIKVISKDSVLKKDHSPRIAGMYSAIIPGLGQAYNHKYWKIPVLYVGEAFMVYYAVQQQNYYKDFKSKYEHEYYKPLDQQSTDSLNYYGLVRDGYRKNRDMLFFFTGLIYAANIIDAMVDAYFFHFDISDNLTMKIEPDVNYPVLAMGKISYGFKLNFKF